MFVFAFECVQLACVCAFFDSLECAFDRMMCFQYRYRKQRPLQPPSASDTLCPGPSIALPLGLLVTSGIPLVLVGCWWCSLVESHEYGADLDISCSTCERTRIW